VYQQFRQLFPDLNVEVVSDDILKSPDAKEKWRPFLMSWEHRVLDFNMGTLLRSAHVTLCLSRHVDVPGQVEFTEGLFSREHNNRSAYGATRNRPTGFIVRHSPACAILLYRDCAEP